MLFGASKRLNHVFGDISRVHFLVTLYCQCRYKYHKIGDIILMYVISAELRKIIIRRWFI